MSKESPVVIVLSRQECERWLERESPFSALISINSPSGKRLKGYETQRRPKLRLEFDDIWFASSGYRWPQKQDVQKAVSFVRTLDPAPGLLVVHCEAGISRSSALGAICWKALMPEIDERTILREMRRWNHEMFPNALVIQHGDEVLGSNFYQACQQEWKGEWV